MRKCAAHAEVYEDDEAYGIHDVPILFEKHKSKCSSIEEVKNNDRRAKQGEACF